ncbi:MAG: serine/threonine-protein kinase, partial [Polyangiaceae bacterium]
LEAAHRAGIVHRDLKPDNIRLVPDPRAGGRDGITVKVLDFGVAKVLGASKKTQHGMVFGTPHYMSPEQGDGGGIDGRSDVYSLGIIVYECLAGELPFVAETFLGVLQQHLFEEPPPIEGALGSLPLEPIMQRCLQKNPDDRYPSMAAVAAAIQRASPAREAGLDSSGIRSRGHDEPTVITGDRAKRPKPYFALVAVGAIALTASVVAFRPTAPDTAAHSAKLSDLAPQLQAERREPAPAPPPPATSAPGPTSSAAPSAIPVVAPPPRQWQEAEEVDPPTAPTGVVDPWPY